MTAPIKLSNISFVTDLNEKHARKGLLQMSGAIGASGPTTGPAPAPQYPAVAQFDLRVEDDLIDRVARRGDRLRCVDLEIAGIDAEDGDLVVIAMHDSDKTRLLVRRLGRLADRTVFSQDRADPTRAGEPIVVMKNEAQNAQFTIVAKALFAWSRVAD
jgi:hypothetical protein